MFFLLCLFTVSTKLAQVTQVAPSSCTEKHANTKSHNPVFHRSKKRAREPIALKIKHVNPSLKKTDTWRKFKRIALKIKHVGPPGVLSDNVRYTNPSHERSKKRQMEHS